MVCPYGRHVPIADENPSGFSSFYNNDNPKGLYKLPNNNRPTSAKGKTAPKSKNSSGQKPRSKTKTAPPKEPEAKARRNDENRLIHQVMPYLLIVCAIFITVCYFFEGSVGIVGNGIRKLFFGLFAGGAFCIPLFMISHAAFWSSDVKNRSLAPKFVFSLICLIFISTLIHTFGTDRENLTYSVNTLYTSGLKMAGGGVIGGLLSVMMLRAVGFSGTLIISISSLVIFGIFLFGLTPRNIWLYIAYKRTLAKERREEERVAALNRPRASRYISDTIQEKPPAPHTPPVQTDPVHSYTFKKGRRRFNPDVEIGEQETSDKSESNENLVDMNAYEAVEAEEASLDTEQKANMSEAIQPVYKASLLKKGIEDIANSELDLNEIFANPNDIEMIKRYSQDNISETDANHTAEIELSVEKRRISERRIDPTPVHKPAASVPAALPEYNFPPIELLTPGEAPRNVDVAAELQGNAVKLVETLSSFNVRTKIVSVSRGPTITRYELAPEAGTRVRSIANLVDDIALNLATTGVRIETPIPGKAAVGIEVPNKVVATVHLRELIDSDNFRGAQSKLTACLGVDVAGSPIICDLSKMPHLLIAGATGMGKSVCMNSIIVSLLYKATPDEVKFILVDPKKVELNVYNGIPHLLVPVVTDPKKAAGALHWAVTEMERRFELIEQAGVRNIQNYNAIAAKNHEMEFMPQIVIIIDELADLMMTAPDAVEESINRLAQKARAAGMHLILGTQRPSVDVITGLIKANIPSRIAFTVASQIDSRTIIDIAGAEKLIGRGDMLFAPVGASKPMRVQGSFVSEGEVEAITEFLKGHIGVSEYDSNVIESIEREAARCVQSKRSGGGDDISGEDDADPMIRPAIELAIECGKISTSLIQRRLSLGYGRAAKLIDKMERMGYVSPPDGQKPRDVLITKQQFMEMVVRDENIG